MTLIENAVPLADVARVCKTTVTKLEAEAKALNLFIGEDWTGAPAVSPADASELRTGGARERQEHAARWDAHLAEVQAWTQARERAVQVASRVAFEEARRGGAGDPRAASDGKDAAVEAGRAFEAQNPPPTFDRAGNTAAVRRFAEPSAIRRVAERVKAAVA